MDGATPNPSLDLSALTPKQQDMALARNPMGGNELNANSMQTREINKQVDNQRKGVATQQQAQQSNLAPPQAQGTQGGQAAGAAQRNLATFTNRIAAKLNQFVSGGDVSKLSLDLPAEFKPKWNPTTKSFEMPDIDSARFSTDEIARLKAQQVEAIKGEMSPYFDYTDIGGVTNVRAKGFEDILKQFADLNNDGVLDAQEQKFLDESFQIAQQIQRLDKIDPRSAEARALQMQLELADRDGLVSGIYRALDQYKRISGDDRKGPTLYSGIGGDDLNLENIVNMNIESIQQELLKALTGQESVFTGDFESELTSNRLRTNLEKSQAFRVETDTALAKAAEDWGTALDEQFNQQRERINTGFRDMYTDRIPQYFNKLKEQATARGESTAPLDAAMQWFDDLSKSNDPAQVIYDLLNNPDSGLAVNQRQMLAKWLGDASGTGMGQTGLIRATLNSIAQKGFVDVSTTDPKGNPQQITVEFNDRDRMNIAKLLADTSLTEEQKSAAISSLIDRKISERMTASTDLATVQKYFADGSFESGLEAFAESLVKSLNSFSNSATQALWNKVVKARPGEFTDGVTDGGDPRDFINPEMIDSIVAAAQDEADKLTKKINEVTQIILPELEKKKEQAALDLTELDRIDSVLNTSVANAVQTTTDSMINAASTSGYPGFAELIVQGFKNKAVAEGVNPNNIDWGQLEPIAKTYTMMANIGTWINSQGESYVRDALKNNKVYNTHLNILKDPLAWLKGLKVFSGGGISPSAIASANSMASIVSIILKQISSEVVLKSPYGSAVESKRKAIEESRNRANTFTSEADKYEALVQNISANSQAMLKSLRIYSPQDIANLAMKMARAGEMGYTDLGDFIDMSEYNFTADDLAKLQTDLTVRPLYAGSAVKDMDDGYRFEPLQGPSVSADLLKFGATPKSGAATPYRFDTPNYSSPIPIFEGVAKIGDTLGISGRTPAGPSQEELNSQAEALYADVMSDRWTGWNHPILASNSTIGRMVTDRLTKELVASGPDEIYKKMQMFSNGKPLPAAKIGNQAAATYLINNNLADLVAPKAITQHNFKGDYFKYQLAKMAGIQIGEDAATVFKKLYALKNKLPTINRELARKLESLYFQGW